MAGYWWRGGLAGLLGAVVMLLMQAGPVHAYRFDGAVCRFDSVGSYIGTGPNARSLSNNAGVPGLNCPTLLKSQVFFYGDQVTNAATGVDAYRLNNDVFTRRGGTTYTPTDAHGRCRYVDKSASTGDYFVPLGTPEEWLAFTNNPPPGVRVMPCARAYTSDVDSNVADITGKYFFGPSSAIVGDRVGAFDGQSALRDRNRQEGRGDSFVDPRPRLAFVKDKPGQRDLHANVKLPYWRYHPAPRDAALNDWPPADSPYNAQTGVTSHTFTYSCAEDISIDYCKRWSFVGGAWACVGGYASRCGVKWKSWTETFDIKARAKDSDAVASGAPSWQIIAPRSKRVAGTARPNDSCCVVCSQIDANTCSCDSRACGGPPRITPVNGVCGAANHTTVAVQPAFSLCVSGNASAVAAAPAGTWAWTCAGRNTGTSANCMACRPGYVWTGSGCGLVQAGRCGAAVNTCNVGTVLNLPDSATHKLWTCVGVNGGANASCSSPYYTGTWTPGRCSTPCGPGTINFPTCSGGNGMCDPATRPASGGACNLGACPVSGCMRRSTLYGIGTTIYVTNCCGDLRQTTCLPTGNWTPVLCPSLCGCCSCFPPDTPALTVERGWQPISQIKVGEAVVTFDADGKRGAAIVRGQKITPDRKLRAINGVRISTRQKIQMADGSYKTVAELKLGDVLVNSDDKPEKIKTLVDLPGMHTVYNLVFDSHDTPFLAAGVRVKDWE